MIDTSWQIDHDDWDPDVVGACRPLLGTWHFIRAALRREWRTWVGLALVGGLLGAAAVLFSPPSSTSTVSVMLAHTPGTDPTDAMKTDISLLTTRAVASDVVDTLGLGMTPESFQPDGDRGSCDHPNPARNCHRTDPGSRRPLARPRC